MKHKARNLLVLIVDDEPEIHLSTEILFKSLGFKTARAVDGADGVREARRLRPDLILLDIDMPKMNGIRALKLLRDLADTKNIPVIMLTANSDLWVVKELAESGISGYVKKPYNPKDLLSRVEEILFAKPEK